MTKTYMDPLTESAMQLAAFSAAIEAEADLTPMMVSEFKSLAEAQEREVSKVISFCQMIESQVELVKQNLEYWKERKKKLDQLEAKFEEHIKSVLQENPDIPFSCKLGSLKLQNNPPAVDFAFEKLDEETISVFNIPDKYVRKKTTYEINKTQLLADMKLGQEFPWARLKQDQHWRIKQ